MWPSASEQLSSFKRGRVLCLYSLKTGYFCWWQAKWSPFMDENREKMWIPSSAIPWYKRLESISGDFGMCSRLAALAWAHWNPQRCQQAQSWPHRETWLDVGLRCTSPGSFPRYTRIMLCSWEPAPRPPSSAFSSERIQVYLISDFLLKNAQWAWSAFELQEFCYCLLQGREQEMAAPTAMANTSAPQGQEHRDLCMPLHTLRPHWEAWGHGVCPPCSMPLPAQGTWQEHTELHVKVFPDNKQLQGTWNPLESR